jgi:hypothetical protein
MKIDPQPIIDEYRAAYLKANGRQMYSDILYQAGWFVFLPRYGTIVQGRYRAAQMREMIARLNARWPEHVHAADAAKEEA